jgi:hypothetical protein
MIAGAKKERTLVIATHPSSLVALGDLPIPPHCKEQLDGHHRNL